MENGAKSVRSIVTHGVLSGPAYDRIKESKLSSFIVSDTLSVDSDKVDVVSCNVQIYNSIRAINQCISIEYLKNH
jgi:ribose-phosphate pyrophosphokinase